MGDVEHFLCPIEATIRDVMASIDRNAGGIALLVDDQRRLVGTVTDGDLRRAILSGHRLDDPAVRLLGERVERYARAVTAPVGTPEVELLQLMHERAVRHVPLLDDEGRVADVVLLDGFVFEPRLPTAAVVMAGGLGMRLRPLTDDVPKPMLAVGDQPLLERTIRRLSEAGIRKVEMTTHYKPEVIVDHFGDGSAYGVEIGYIEEGEPQGTAGSLRQIEPADDSPVLVMNGDVLTRVDFRALAAFHQSHGADLTMAVREYRIDVPFGVVQTQDIWVRAIEEKPQLVNFINAGIYLLEPSVWSLIPADRPFDMPDLIRALVDDGRRVACFPILEYWLDIGQLEDYERAQSDADKGVLE